MIGEVSLLARQCYYGQKGKKVFMIFASAIPYTLESIICDSSNLLIIQHYVGLRKFAHSCITYSTLFKLSTECVFYGIVLCVLRAGRLLDYRR